MTAPTATCPGCSCTLLLLPPHMQAVFLELGKARPTVKLLYVTPEQLVKGQRLKAILGCVVGGEGGWVGECSCTGWSASSCMPPGRGAVPVAKSFA